MNRYEVQKQASREAILTAALLTFKEMGYYAASVEDIITRGKVSRATFYKNFKNKLSVSEALAEKMAENIGNAYEQLGSIDNPNLSNIISWLYQIIEITEKNKLLLSVLAGLFSVEPKLSAVAAAADINRIRKLSKGIPAFRSALIDTARGSETRDRVQLLLYEVDSISFRLVVHEWKVEKKAAVHFLAHQIQNFIVELSSEFSTEATETTL